LSIAIPDVVLKSMLGKMVRQHGINAEQKAVRLLKEAGWVAGRLRRGPIDIVAAKEGIVLLVQVKSGKARAKRAELEEMVRWARAFDADTEVWYFKGRRTVKRRVFAVKRTPPSRAESHAP
jgi:Holliday junction resolvase